MLQNRRAKVRKEAIMASRKALLESHSNNRATTLPSSPSSASSQPLPEQQKQSKDKQLAAVDMSIVKPANSAEALIPENNCPSGVADMRTKASVPIVFKLDQATASSTPHEAADIGDIQRLVPSVCLIKNCDAELHSM